MHCERTQTPETAYCMIPILRNVQKGQLIGAGLVVVWSSGLEQGLTVNEYGDLAKVTREF